MEFSYEGIGQWAAAFACADVREGQAVKLTGDSTLGPCGAGDRFCGVVLAVGRDGAACTAALGGMVTVGFSGDQAPAAGWCKLAADGQGGVTAGGDAEYLVVSVDESSKTVTFVL